MLQRNFIYLRSGNLDGFNVDPWFKSFRQTQWILLDIQRPLWKAHALPWKALPFWKIYIWALKSTMKATKSRGGLQLTALQWNWLQQLTCGITTLETIIIKALLRKWWLIFNASTIFNTCQFVLSEKGMKKASCFPITKLKSFLPWHPYTVVRRRQVQHLELGHTSNLLENKNSSVWQH